MRNLISFVGLCILFSTTLFSQSLGDFNPGQQKYGLNKIKGDEKRVYIASFLVNYQLFNARTEFKQGGHKFGGGVRGDATAKLAVAISGVSEDQLVEATDALYADFTKQLTDAGFVLISPDEAAKSEVYSEWGKSEGGKAFRGVAPGVVSAAPTGFVWYSKNPDKVKKGRFAAVNEQGTYGSLSNQLEGAIIADVELTVLFTEEGKNWNVGEAKIKMQPNLRLIDTYTIVNDKEKKGPIGLKGAQTYTTVASKVNFYHGKVGMGIASAYLGSLKKPLEIEGVVDQKKLVSFAKQSSDTVGFSNAFYTVYSEEARTTEEIKALEVDGAKYKDGAVLAGKRFIDEHVGGFLSSL